MNRYFIQLFIIMEGVSDTANLEFHINAETEQDAEVYFATLFGAFQGPMFTHTITLL